MSEDTITKKEPAKKKAYIEAVGRRKTSVARARIKEASKMSTIVNDKDVADYFKTVDLQTIVSDPFTKNKITTKFEITIKVQGGGIHSQSEAVRHAISRCLNTYDEELHTKLKKLGFV